MGQFQAGKWTLGFVGSLLLAGGLSVTMISIVEPYVGLWAVAAAFVPSYASAWFCVNWVQKRYGRPIR